jgi:uncharacterized membrane protein YciS (DUF1049 family)
MRFVYLFFLAIFIAAVALFAFQNRETVTVAYLNQSLSCSLALLIGAVYLLGMLSGWTIVGFVRRSVRRVTARPKD